MSTVYDKILGPKISDMNAVKISNRGRLSRSNWGLLSSGCGYARNDELQSVILLE